MPFANIKQNAPADRIENHLSVVGAPLLFLRVRQFKSKGLQSLFLLRLHLAITVHIVEHVPLMDMGCGLVQMERPINDVDVFTETALQLHHKFPDNFQQHLRGNGVLHGSDLVDGFLRAEAFVCQQIIHAPVTLRVAAFCVPLMLPVKVIRVAVQIKGSFHIRKGHLAVLLGRIGRAPETIPIDVLRNSFPVNVVGVIGIKGPVIVR
jgi:hypothetical protein